MPLLENEFRRIGRLPPKPKAMMDTLEIVRRVKVSRPHNLGSLCHRHGISLIMHILLLQTRGIFAVVLAPYHDHALMFRNSLEEIERWLIHGKSNSDDSNLGRGLNDLEMLDSLGKIRIDDGHYIVAFGRHRGRHLTEAAQIDPSYINWLLSPSGIEDEEARKTIKEFLS